jgi:anaerobic nitric oxide reductase transcription regulator
MIKRAGVLSKARTHSADIELLVSDFDIYTSPSATSDGRNTPDISSINQPNVGLKEATDRYQKKVIEQTLNLNQGNWAATARQLELDSGNLHRLAKRLGIK